MQPSDLAVLVYQLAKREVSGRYKGSLLGIVWSFVNPVLMLCVYTVFFSVILKVRWGDAPQSRSEFAMLLFVGLLMHGFIAECIIRAPGLVVGNVNYVKKVVFPLAVLPVVSVCSALFHWAIGMVVLAGALWVLGHGVPPTFPLVLVVMVPLVFYGLGLSWLLSLIGVFIRDVTQVVGVIAQILLFLSPVFFPITSIPEAYRGLFLANPLTTLIEQAREVVIRGQVFDWGPWFLQLLASVLFCTLGLLCFRRAKAAFADVL